MLQKEQNKDVSRSLPSLLNHVNPLSANATEWPNTLKQFVDKLPTNCLIVFDHFAGLVLKGLITHSMPLVSFYTTWKHRETSGFLIFIGGCIETTGMKLVKTRSPKQNAKSTAEKMYKSNNFKNLIFHTLFKFHIFSPQNMYPVAKLSKIKYTRHSWKYWNFYKCSNFLWWINGKFRWWYETLTPLGYLTLDEFNKEKKILPSSFLEISLLLIKWV